jgi:hypothetical protein
MRSVISLVIASVVALSAAPAAAENALVVDVDAVGDAAVAAAAHSGSLVPLLLPLPAQNTSGGGGGGGDPPMLSGVGLGIQLGFPTAVTLKLGKAHDNNFAFGLGAGFGYRSFLPSLSVHGDYQLHLVTLIKNSDLSVTGYIAPGLWLAFFGSGGYGFFNPVIYAPGYLNFVGVGARLSFGASVLVTRAPVEIYLELTPAVFVFPAIDPAVGFSLGFRYYF